MSALPDDFQREDETIIVLGYLIILLLAQILLCQIYYSSPALKLNNNSKKYDG